MGDVPYPHHCEFERTRASFVKDGRTYWVYKCKTEGCPAVEYIINSKDLPPTWLPRKKGE